MQLGLVSAILADLSLEEVFATAAELGYHGVEVMCWPAGKADRRYAGVSHLDVAGLNAEGAAETLALAARYGVSITGLGYYPNPLNPDPAARAAVGTHLERVIRAAALLKLPVVNTFIGRDPAKTIEASWPDVREVWTPLVRLAESLGVRIAIENCPMIFSDDEWPGGKNLAHSPAAWRRLFREVPSPAWALNLDPSHLVWLMIDAVPVIREFGHLVAHVHAKDARLDRHKLQEVGVLALDWHTPKLPGFGDVNWGAFFGALADAGYTGPVCVEVEDRAFEGSLEARKRALSLSRRFLESFVG